MAKHAKSTQNLFAISLQYLKNKGRDEVGFLHVDKHQTLLQVDTISLGGHGQSCPKSSKQVQNEVDFLQASKNQSFP